MLQQPGENVNLSTRMTSGIKRIGTVAVATASMLAVSSAPASAESEYSMTETWGSAAVSATSESRPGFMKGYDVSMTVTVNDHLKNDKCVYVEYRIITKYGRDGDATIAKACNRQEVMREKTVVVGDNLFGAKGEPDAVEFKMCHAVWGVDPCVKSKVEL